MLRYCLKKNPNVSSWSSLGILGWPEVVSDGNQDAVVAEETDDEAVVNVDDNKNADEDHESPAKRARTGR